MPCWPKQIILPGKYKPVEVDKHNPIILGELRMDVVQKHHSGWISIIPDNRHPSPAIVQTLTTREQPDTSMDQWLQGSITRFLESTGIG
jgi:hypothetical protein